jgi:hypothetical protein
MAGASFMHERFVDTDSVVENPERERGVAVGDFCLNL